MRALLATLTLAAAACGALYHPLEPHHQCPSECTAHGDDMGANSDPSSSLRRTEAIVAGSYADGRNVQSEDAWVQGRYTGDHVTLFGRTGISHYSSDIVESNGAKYAGWTFTNAEIGIGYHWFSTALGGLYRRGIGIRGELGIDDYQPTPSRGSRVPLFNERPYDLLRYAPGQHFQTMLELRYELVGCRAPFIHLQAGLRGRWDGAPGTLGVPLSIAVGAYVFTDIAVYGEYSALIGDYPLRDIDWLSRFRFGMDFPLGDVHLDVHLDAISDAGYDLMGMFVFPFGGKEKP